MITIGDITITMGQMLFLGGIAGTAIFGLSFVISWAVFEKKKKKLMKEIEKEISE